MPIAHPAKAAHESLRPDDEGPCDFQEEAVRRNPPQVILSGRSFDETPPETRWDGHHVDLVLVAVRIPAPGHGARLRSGLSTVGIPYLRYDARRRRGHSPVGEAATRGMVPTVGRGWGLLGDFLWLIMIAAVVWLVIVLLA